MMAALPERSRENVLRLAKIVDLKEGVSLFHSGDRNDVLFPLSSVVTLFREFEDGTMLQVAMIGPEGLVDVNTILGEPVTPYHWIVQSAGLAARLPAPSFAGLLDQDEPLRRLMLKYVHVRVMHASQLAACNRLHVVTERLACWLLLLHDRVPSEEMTVTQEFLARMLGTRRAGINVAMRELRDCGAIGHRRNRVIILNRDVLHEQSCSCYDIMAGDFSSTLGFAARPKELHGAQATS